MVGIATTIVITKILNVFENTLRDMFGKSKASNAVFWSTDRTTISSRNGDMSRKFCSLSQTRFPSYYFSCELSGITRPTSSRIFYNNRNRRIRYTQIRLKGQECCVSTRMILLLVTRLSIMSNAHTPCKVYISMTKSKKEQ